MYKPRVLLPSSHLCNPTSDSRIIPRIIQIISAGRVGSFSVSKFREQHKHTVVTHCRLALLHRLWLAGDQYRNCSTCLLLLALHGMKSVLNRGQSPKQFSQRGRRCSGTTASDSREHPLNASSPICVTLLGIVTAVRPMHFQNVKSPISVTLLGIVTAVSPVHPAKAPSPISITLLGIVTAVSPVQS